MGESHFSVIKNTRGRGAAESGTQQGPALAAYLGVLRAQVLQEARRSFDIREEQRDGSRWQVRHLAPPDK